MGSAVPSIGTAAPGGGEPATAVGRSAPALFLDLWLHRAHIWRLARQDLRSRYAGSAMGILWAGLHPLATLVVFTVVFSRLMNPRVPQLGEGNSLSFAIYLCVGLFPWVAFQEAIQRGGAAFIEQAPLLKKLYFPEPVFVAMAVLSATFNLGASLALLLPLLLVAGVSPGPGWLAVPLLIVLQQVLAFAFALLVATFQVFFRDIGQMLTIAFQAWFWLTPIVYVSSVLPPWIQPLLQLNPAYHLVESYHQALLTGGWPAPGHLAALVIFAAALMALARAAFIRLQADLRDEI